MLIIYFLRSPTSLGESTRSHFYGENVERYTLIDAYRRPPTCYAGRVIMDCGRPADGYYAQRFPGQITNCDALSAQADMCVCMHTCVCV